MPETQQQLLATAQVGDAISEGESRRGGYNAYNSGTSGNRIYHSGVKDLFDMTVDQILDSSRLSARDSNRVFAAGKYQVITSTLRQAKASMHLSGSELFTPQLQERIFLEFLLGKKRPKIGAYITHGQGSSTEAVYECAKEWASVEVPAGRAIQRGTVSNGHLSYYESHVNHARHGSGQRVQSALEHARHVFLATQNGEDTGTPEPLTAAVGDDDEIPATESRREDRPQEPKAHGGQLIQHSVGARGHNAEQDVGAVQNSLIQHGYPLGVADHIVGPQTIHAIKAFQATFMKHPDGLVESGKTTEHHLLQHGSSPTHAPHKAAGIEEADSTDTETVGAETEVKVPPTTESEDKAVTAPQISGEDLQALMAEARLSPEQIARARALIGREPKSARPALYRELQDKVVYANQRDNKATLGGKQIETGHGEMCNLTALAMCLQYLGIPNPHPDMQYEDALEKVRQQHHFRARTTPEGWGAVARACGANVDMLTWNGTHDRNWWRQHVGAAVSSGKSVMTSITGHIVRIQDVDDDGIVVDDPYGKRVLLPGGKKHWKIVKNNAKNSGGHEGENNLWTWEHVERHSFLWVAAFSR